MAAGGEQATVVSGPGSRNMEDISLSCGNVPYLGISTSGTLSRCENRRSRFLQRVTKYYREC